MGDRHHIVRIDIDDPDNPDAVGTHGWQVKVRRQGRVHTKFFNDRKYGGPDLALAEAEPYRDSLLKALPPPSTGIERSREARAQPVADVPGLRLVWRDRADGPAPYVQISWMEGADRRSSSFSVQKHGFQKALYDACLKLKRRNDYAEDPTAVYQRAYGPLQAEITARLGDDPR